MINCGFNGTIYLHIIFKTVICYYFISLYIICISPIRERQILLIYIIY